MVGTRSTASEAVDGRRGSRPYPKVASAMREMLSDDREMSNSILPKLERFETGRLDSLPYCVASMSSISESAVASVISRGPKLRMTLGELPGPTKSEADAWPIIFESRKRMAVA